MRSSVARGDSRVRTVLQAPHALQKRRLTSAPANPNLVADLFDPSSELCLPAASDLSELRGPALRPAFRTRLAHVVPFGTIRIKDRCFQCSPVFQRKTQRPRQAQAVANYREQRTCMQSIHGRGSKIKLGGPNMLPTVSEFEINKCPSFVKAIYTTRF